MRSAFVYNFLIEANIMASIAIRNLLWLAAGGHPVAVSAVSGQSADP